MSASAGCSVRKGRGEGQTRVEAELLPPCLSFVKLITVNGGLGKLTGPRDLEGASLFLGPPDVWRSLRAPCKEQLLRKMEIGLPGCDTPRGRSIHVRSSYARN